MSLVKQILILVLIAAIGAGGYWGYTQHFGDPFAETQKPNAGKRRRGGAHRVEVAAVRQQTVRDTVEAVGTTRAAQAIEVVALTAGRVIELVAKPGEEVAKGAPLVRLDSDIEKANLAEAEAKLAKARSFLARSRALQERRATSIASVEQLQAEAAAAAAEVDRAKRRLADRVIRASFAGKVGLNKVEVGARVDSNSVLTTLDDLSHIEIEFQLPEVVFGRTEVGMAVIAEAAAFPNKKFEGKIVNVDTRIDRTSRTFLVRASVPNPKRTLPAGMFMRLSAILDERKALVVPEEAVVAEGGSNFVFLVQDGRAARVEVQPGQRKPGLVEILSGVSPGQVAVVRGFARLRNGKKVRIVAGPGAQKSERQRGKGNGPGKKGRTKDGNNSSASAAANGEQRLAAEGAVTEIRQGGRLLVWRTKNGKSIELRVSGRRTKIEIDGTSADRKNLKVGMICRATTNGTANVVAQLSCKQKSGA